MSENPESTASAATGQGGTVAPVPQPTPNKSWVQFDDEKSPAKPDAKDSPAVITTESVQVNLERSLNKSLDNGPPPDPKPLRNVELPIATVEPIRQGFCEYTRNFPAYDWMLIFWVSANGDIIVTLLPVNTKLPWITPAQFRPELVPEELMAQGLTVRLINFLVSNILNKYNLQRINCEK